MLFAQEATDVTLQPDFALFPLFAIGLAAILLGLAIVFVVLLLRHLRFAREKQHEERLKMIEMGYPLEDSESSRRQDRYIHNVFWISFWMVVAVPGGAFSAAATATQQLETGGGVLLAIWIGAAVASVAAVVCAAVLMLCSRAWREDETGVVPPEKPVKQLVS